MTLLSFHGDPALKERMIAEPARLEPSRPGDRVAVDDWPAILAGPPGRPPRRWAAAALACAVALIALAARTDAPEASPRPMPRTPEAAR